MQKPVFQSDEFLAGPLGGPLVHKSSNFVASVACLPVKPYVYESRCCVVRQQSLNVAGG